MITIRWLLILVGAPVLYAADFCALKVTVVNFNNQPASGVSVDLRNDKGIAQSGRTNERGEIYFCDFGFSEHAVNVRDEFCNDIVVRRIVVNPTTQKIVTVMLNQCIVNMGRPTSCFCLLRVRTRQDEPIPGAEMRIGPKRTLFVSNANGVLHFGIAVGTVFRIEFNAAGFSTAKREIKCAPDEPLRETIILDRVTLP